ncbi:MAG: HAMP domain-containing sensor histidine kinase [Eubacteriales bacterium]|nr:HAMP domain-containing sensor histidine kinase [Eubacteriales bacterium]
MRLGKKTLVYSLTLAAVMAVLLIGHMIFLLPPLYIDYQKNHSIELIKQQHFRVVEDDGIDQLADNVALGGLVSVMVEQQTETIRFSTAYGRGTIKVTEPKLMELVNRLKELAFRATDEEADFDDINEELEATFKEQSDELIDYFKHYYGQAQTGEQNALGLPFDIEAVAAEVEQVEGGNKFELLSNNTLMLRSHYVEPSGAATYQAQLLLTKVEDRIYITAASQMIPQLTDIRPVLMQSLPMVLMVTVLVVFLGAAWFSRKLVQPVVQMRRFAKGAKTHWDTELAKVEVKGKDELAELANDMYDLYETKRGQYVRLRENSRRKEVFLRASSHRLKTPVAATLLLVEGMINKVGRYADTDRHLPQVKEQLLSMKKMIDDVLYLNRADRDPQPEAVDIHALIDNVALRWLTDGQEHGCTLTVVGDAIWQTDAQMLVAIIENVIGNAFEYTHRGGRIEAHVTDESITIENEPAHIDENLLADIKEPFVTGHKQGSNHGLGLYLADYYAGLLNLDLTMENTEQGVRVTLANRKETT